MEESHARAKALEIWTARTGCVPVTRREFDQVQAVALYIMSGKMPEPTPLPKAA